MKGYIIEVNAFNSFQFVKKLRWSGGHYLTLGQPFYGRDS